MGSAPGDRQAIRSLVVQPATQLVEWYHYVLPVGGTLLQTPIPRLHIWNGWSLYFELEIPEERGASRNID